MILRITARNVAGHWARRFAIVVDADGEPVAGGFE
jgi:hypothetical protein